MEPSHYLNIKSRSDGHLYKYLAFSRLLEMFAGRRNVLVHPSKWEDPFENFILNGRIRSADGAEHRFGFRDRVYSQCWTTEARSDAMWRIYSKKLSDGTYDGVRIRTTVTKLANSLSHSLEFGENGGAFIGGVEYLSDKVLFEKANLLFEKGVNPAAVASSLLLKRNAFSHEKEVRLIYRKLTLPEGDTLYRYKVDPHLLIDQIMLDPRTPPAKVNEIKKLITEQTSFQGNILWSLLYNPPKNVVVSVNW